MGACALGYLEGIGYYVCMGVLVVMMGSVQAYTRSLFSSLAPIGMESAMFALLSVTDQGASLIGSAVIAVVHTSTDSYLGVYWYCAFAFTVSLSLLLLVDVEEGTAAAGKIADKPG